MTGSLHQQRVERVQALFAYGFDPTQSEKIGDVIVHLPEIDALIAKYATERPIDQINKLDLAILRIAVFEWVYEQQEPGILIDEAITIAKEYSGESSGKFVHAVIDSIVKNTPKV